MQPFIVVLVTVAVVAAVAIWVAVRRRRARALPLVPVAPTAAPPPVGMRERLGTTRRALADRLGSAFGRGGIEPSFWVDLEDSLVAADMGVATASRLVAAVRSRAPESGEAARSVLEGELVALLAGRQRSLVRGSAPSVILVVGVNGGGKTTSIAKLAARLKTEGSSVVLGSADTFRAAADEQLRAWATRVGVEVVGGAAGTDPAAVAFDAYKAARVSGAEVVIIDTAGRLQNKANLMDELGKVARVLRREAGHLDEVLLVIDGTTGQNAIAQARTFTEAVGVTGIVLTKLDGTARGGVAVAVEQELGIPVKFIGVGEGKEDLIPFDAEMFVDALLGV